MICRPNPEPLWREVAERYQQIIEKDIKLLQYPSSPDDFSPFKTHITATSSLGNKRINNNRCPSRSAMLMPREMKERLHLAARDKKNKDAVNLPKIVDVFSLNPSVPERHFQEHVTVRVEPNGTIIGATAGHGKPDKINEYKQNSKISEKVKEKLRSFVDGHTTSVQEDYNRQTPFCKSYFQMEQFATTTTNHMDLMVEENKSVKSGSTPEKNSGNDAYSGCHTTQKGGIPTTEDDGSIDITKHVAEEANLENSAKSTKKKRKRETIFVPVWVKKKSRTDRHDDITKTEQHLLEDQHTIDEIENNGCNYLNKDIISMHNKIKDNNTIIHKKSVDRNFLQKEDDEKNPGNPGKKFNGTTESDEDNAPAGVTSHLRGNDVRQNKILDLKEKLAKQEQQLEELKRKRETTGANMENCGSPAGGGPDVEENVAISSHQTNSILCTVQNEEKDQWGEAEIFYHSDLDVNPGKIDDLKEIFQKVIKSFRILDTRLYVTKTGIVIDYGDIRSKNDITDKHVLFHVDNRMKLLPEDFLSKDEFLLQLGLLRI